MLGKKIYNMQNMCECPTPVVMTSNGPPVSDHDFSPPTLKSDLGGSTKGHILPVTYPCIGPPSPPPPPPKPSVTSIT